VLVGFAVHNLPLKSVLRPGVLAGIAQPRGLGGESGGPIRARLAAAVQVTVSDFLDMMAYFIFGAAAAALFSTSVNQEVIVPLAVNNWLATGSMMLLAAILSLCSTSDAFIAATFVSFPQVAKLAFLVFGPMVDLKLVFIYSSVFRKRFIAGLVAGLFVLIGLVCVRLQVVFQ